jgi:hypothetical protein
MAANVVSGNYGVTYSFYNNRLESGELITNPPVSPEDVYFVGVTYKQPLGKPIETVAIIVETLVRSFIFENKAELSSGVELKLRITPVGIEIAPNLDEKFPENQNFVSYAKKNCQGVFGVSPGTNTTIDLKIALLRPEVKAMGLATGYLRYPHMLADMRIRFAFDRFKEDAQVCIIGPGLMEYDSPKPGDLPPPEKMECPQFVEVLSLFRKASFTLLDIDPKSLAAYQKSFTEEKIACYDPLTLRVLSSQKCDGDINPMAAPESYESVLSLVKDGLTALAEKPAKVRLMMDGFEKAEHILLKINPEKIHIKNHDILVTQMTVPDLGYDVIIGTHSIGNALQLMLEADITFDVTRSFTEILSAIRPGGVLYLDSICYGNIVNNVQYYSRSSFDDYLNIVGKTLGNKMKVEEVSHKTFYPDSDANGAVSRSYLLTLDRTRTLGCTSITVISRTMEPA